MVERWEGLLSLSWARRLLTRCWRASLRFFQRALLCLRLVFLAALHALRSSGCVVRSSLIEVGLSGIVVGVWVWERWARMADSSQLARRWHTDPVSRCTAASRCDN